MKAKIIVIIINAVICAALWQAIGYGIKTNKENKEMFTRLRMVENERNALSDAIRCYADSADTTIIDYSRWYLKAVGCPDSLEDWGNLY